MATTMTVVGTTVFGNMRVVYGTFTNDSATGTTQTLGLGSAPILIGTDNAGLAVGLSYSGTTLTLTCESTSTGGTWAAIGS